MDTKKASKISWKHIVCCIVILIIFVLTIGTHIDAEGLHDNEPTNSDNSEVVPLSTKVIGIVAEIEKHRENEVNIAGPKQEVTVDKKNINYYITKYSEELAFFSKAFGTDYDLIIEDLNDREKNNSEELNEKNVGFIRDEQGNLKTFDSIEYGIVEYFYDYVEKNPKKVKNKWEPYQGGSEYIESLIRYYTEHIYTNVDTRVALSIGASESGYYKVKYMLRYNNVYGGMTHKGLKKHKNIEYGVLSYVRMLSRNYYGKGYNTIPSIGLKYCPTKDNNGNKIASQHWVKLVNTAMNKYKDDLSINITDLLER